MDYMDIMEFTSVHYFHTVQNFMRRFMRQTKLHLKIAKPTTNRKPHICSFQDTTSIAYSHAVINNNMLIHLEPILDIL